MRSVLVTLAAGLLLVGVACSAAGSGGTPQAPAQQSPAKTAAPSGSPGDPYVDDYGY